MLEKVNRLFFTLSAADPAPKAADGFKIFPNFFSRDPFVQVIEVHVFYLSALFPVRDQLASFVEEGAMDVYA